MKMLKYHIQALEKARIIYNILMIDATKLEQIVRLIKCVHLDLLLIASQKITITT